MDAKQVDQLDRTRYYGVGITVAGMFILIVTVMCYELVGIVNWWTLLSGLWLSTAGATVLLMVLAGQPAAAVSGIIARLLKIYIYLIV